jgi:hypothetical protein
MNHGPFNSRLNQLVRRYGQSQRDPADRIMHWVYLPAIVFAALGMLFAANFGIALIAIATAILYYSQYGQRVAAQLGGALLAMLLVWTLLMPAHYTIITSLGILAAALIGQFATRPRVGRPKATLASCRQYLLAGPVYALVLIR